MLTPLELSVPAADGLVLKGTLTYPTGGRPGEASPLVVLAHQYPATRDSVGPLACDLLAAGIATLAFDKRDGPAHVTSRPVRGTGHAMAICFEVRNDLLTCLRRAPGTA